MIDFILAFLLGHTSLLTPAPVDIRGSQEINLTKPISAVTDGATLQIDVSSVVSPKLGPFRVPASVLEAFPKGSITATLSQTHGSASVKMVYSGDVMLLSNEVRILLPPKTSIATRVKFDRITITTSKQLPAVKIYWNNVHGK
jgi:hypothetical protein